MFRHIRQTKIRKVFNFTFLHDPQIFTEVQKYTFLAAVANIHRDKDKMSIGAKFTTTKETEKQKNRQK